MEHKKYLLGVFEDELDVLNAIPEIRAKGLKIHDVFCPFPVHGLDHALGHKRPRMGVAAFLFGITGTILAVVFTFWTMGIDWPMNIGGKNFFPFPTNIPIVFELTVLLASFGMGFTFFVMEGLGPTAKPIIFDERSTDDKFVMTFDLAKKENSVDKITSALKSVGASEINEKEV